jgi:hypothetical protein
MTLTFPIVLMLILLVLFLVRLHTGPFLYHFLKGTFWICLGLMTEQFWWMTFAAWDVAWIMIWLERDPNKINRRKPG